MNTRPMFFAGPMSFYDRDRSACEREIEECVGDYIPPEGLGKVFGGIVPHAGWAFSGPTAAKLFVTLKQYVDPECLILLGTSHNPMLDAAEIDSHDSWATPLGPVMVDEDMAGLLLESGAKYITRASEANEEHTNEVQAPFIAKLFPGATFVPIAVPSNKYAVQTGAIIGEVVQNFPKRVAIVSNTDLTHYGSNYGDLAHGRLPQALPWVTSNDRRMIELIEKMDAEAIVPEAARNRNACGPGAIAAGIAAVLELGANSATLLEYTTSSKAMGEQSAGSVVGYASMVFHRK